MGDTEPGSEQDDVSFLRTEDMVCLQCTATGERVCLAAEGFGNRQCFLESIADKNLPPEMSSCVFVLEQALSVRALQEMVTAEAMAQEEGEGGEKGHSSGSAGGGHRTLLYGHAVLLRHGHSNMYLACLSTSSSNDKLAFDVGLQEHSLGEACWWTIHPATKQRSEGEKVRVGDELILVSVATERYLHVAKEGEQSVVNASFHSTQWSIAPFGTGLSRLKNVGCVFGGEVLRFYHGGDECLTIPQNWTESPPGNIVTYEGGPVFSQARSLWRLDFTRNKWGGGFVNWGYPTRIHHITTGHYLGINERRELCLLPREVATITATAFCVRAAKDDKKIIIEEKDEEVIGVPSVRYGDTTFFIQHIETGYWLSYRSYTTKKKGVGLVDEKQAILSEEGKMDDGLEFSRSQEEEAKTARVIRKCSTLFTRFIRKLDSLRSAVRRIPGTPRGSTAQLVPHAPVGIFGRSDQEEMVMSLEDLINYFAQPEADCDHEEKQNKLKALRNRQDLFQEEGILNLILEAIDKINAISAQGLLNALLGEESESSQWDLITGYFYQLLAAIIKGNHTNCAQFAQPHRLDWLFSRLSSQQASEGSGMLDVLHCVLIDSPEALNIMKADHIKAIINLLEKQGRDPKVLDVLCSLCVGNGVAVRSSQTNITDNLLPSRNLLLQTKLVDHVASMRPNIYLGKVEGSAMYRKWYFEVTIDHIERVTHLDAHFRVGWANTKGYVPYPGGGSKWGGNGVGDDLYSFGFDGRNLWTSGRSNPVRDYADETEPNLVKGDVIGCLLDLDIPLITFTVNGMPVRGVFKSFNTDGMFYPVVSFSAKYSCRFLLGGDHGRLKFGPPQGHSPLYESLLPTQELFVEPCFHFGDLAKMIIYGPALELSLDAAFVPRPIDTASITLASYIENVRDKLAENIHEVWAMNKIDQGWSYSEIRDDISMRHPCLTSFERLPISEKKYDINLAVQTLKTILALGYRISVDQPPSRIKTVRLPNDPFLQSNGYKPAPLDLSAIELTPKMEALIDLLAENTHNVWSSERIAQGWTYGLSEDAITLRSPHLVPYKYVDDLIKMANRDTSSEMVKTLLAYGYVLDPPTGDAAAEAEAIFASKKVSKVDYRSYRAEKGYSVSSGKWYYEMEVITPGPIKVGWANLNFDPSLELGDDDVSWAFEINGAKKYSGGSNDHFGKQCNAGDIVGCLLDLNDRAISFSLNGELLLDPTGGEVAFNEIPVGDGISYVPAITLTTGQRARLILGQDVNQLKFFTTCGLQEGFQPFCVNMNRQMTLWYNKDEPIFVNIDDLSKQTIEVVRIPAGSETPPSLKLVHRLYEVQEKATWEFLRLSLPVTINEELIDENTKINRWTEIRRRLRRARAEKSGIRAPGNLEQHMLQSGFSISDVKDLQRGYSDEDAGETPTPQPMGQPPSWTDARKKSAFAKTQSFEQTLTVPSIGEAHAMMMATGGLANAQMRSASSLEGLDHRGRADGAGDDEARKKRGKSPFRFFGGKKSDTPAGAKRGPGRAPEVGIGGPPTINIERAGSTSHIIPPDVPDRPSTLRPPRDASPGGSLQRRGSRSRLDEATPLPSEGDDQLDPSVLDLVDEYFYGVRIYPGQDPSHVFCGWVTSNFKHYDAGSGFDQSMVRQVAMQFWSDDGQYVSTLERQNCYMLNAGELYNEVNPGESQTGSRSNQGMFVGCHVDCATGTITFTADGKPTRHVFRLEPGTKLFPAIIFEATSKDCLCFELGRTPTTLPLSAAILKTSEKHLIPQCPPRLKVQSLQSYTWARVPNVSLRPQALKLSDIRGWSMLVDDPVSMLALYIPEDDRCVDILELIEAEKLLAFHAKTLKLYGALCYQGNHRSAHIICGHVDEKQLLYAIQSEYMSGALRTGFADLLISLHLEFHAYSKDRTQNEFIIPLGPRIRSMYQESENKEQLANSFSTLECVSIRPEMKTSEIVPGLENASEVPKELSAPGFPVDNLKQFVMEALDDAVKKGNLPMRDPIGGNTEKLYVPLLRLADQLLLIGCISDQDLEWLLLLIDPETFDPEYDPEAEHKTKGLMQMKLDEGVKLQMSHILHHLFDLQLRHRIESTISFSDRYVGQVQVDQRQRYQDIKQSDLPSHVAARKTREFRCAPKEQMRSILSFKNLTDESSEEEKEGCPCSEELRGNLHDYHGSLVHRLKVITGGGEDEGGGEEPPPSGFAAKLAALVMSIKSSEASEGESKKDEGEQSREDIFIKKVVSTVVHWAEECEIEDKELIRQMFHLLLRCYNGVGEIQDALKNTYIISETSKGDVVELLRVLGEVRALLPVQMSLEEEAIMRKSLWLLARNRVFFQHPDLIRILRIHENVMDVMMNALSKRTQAQSGQPSGNANGTSAEGLDEVGGNNGQPSPSGQKNQAQEKESDSVSEMVVSCCKFLCFFCRSSRANQKAMFDHLPFLLENSNILLSRPSLRGCVPIDVAYSSLMENSELALALREHYLEKIAVYLSRCGLTSNQELIDKGYPDVGWDPVEGERYLDFLRFCVWVNGESVEENANLVIRLLIRRPDCLGPAIRGEGAGLFAAIKDAIEMSDRIQTENEARGINTEEDEDYIDMGAAILNFYCTLVDLLSRCAPEASTIAQGKNECLRARAILRSLVPLEDLEGVLGLKFVLQSAPEIGKSDMPSSFLPSHKQSIVLFLDRVYGIDTQEIFYRILEDAFLPDIRAATMLERPDGRESEMLLALNRYLGNAVLPLLIKYSHYFGEADNWASLLEATLHTVYRLSKVKYLTKAQREVVSDFLIALTREMQPGQLVKLLRKLTVDVAVLNESTTVALRLLTLHYERCARYYGLGGQGAYGAASEEERRLTMLLFTNIFDSLSRMEYDPDLFGKALPCLSAIACALPPDYSLSQSNEEDLYSKSSSPTGGPYIPEPVDTTKLQLTTDLHNLVQRFSEHYHDAWANRKFETGWSYAETWDPQRKTHPRLKPYNLLSEREKELYKEPVREAVKALLALGWRIEKSDMGAAQPTQNRRDMQSSIADYNPQPIDMSNLTLSRELQNMAERLGENSHDIWAKKMKEETEALGGGIHPQMVPYDLLTDREKRKHRERSQELLKYLQYEGYRVFRAKQRSATMETGTVEKPDSSHAQERRFASSLLEKLLHYADIVSISLKLLKPSINFSRRSSFKAASRDVKFFGKVILPLMEKYFREQRGFFLTYGGIQSGSITTPGIATAREKEMVASLFCKIAAMLRSKLDVIGTDAKISVRCLQVLIQATDAKTICKYSPDFVKTSMLLFFNKAADDIGMCVANLQNCRLTAIRGTTMKTCSSLNYVQLVLFPVLTSVFDHLAANDYGFDLLVDDTQVACLRILNNLFKLGTKPELDCGRKFIKTELDRHRPELGNCLAAFSSCFPVAFLESQHNINNRYSCQITLADRSLEAQAVLQEIETEMPNLETLIALIEKHISSGATYAKEPHTIDVVLPLLCSYLPFWWSHGPDNVQTHPAAMAEGQPITAVTVEHLNRLLKLVLTLISNQTGIADAPWMITIASHAGQIVINSSEELLVDPVLPLAEKITSRVEAVFRHEDQMKGYLKSSTEDTSQLEGQLQEEYHLLVRDIYAFYPLLVKYVDIQRNHWLKTNPPEAEKLYHLGATIFNIWTTSQFFRREEQNFISQNEIDNMALIMPSTGRSGRAIMQKGESSSSDAGGVAAKRKKRKEKRDKEKELAASLMVAALKRLLPVGLNLFEGREQELVQYAKERFLKKEDEEKIFDYIKTQLTLPDKIDPSDDMSWQHYLYSKLGQKHSGGSIDASGNEVALIVPKSEPETAVVDKKQEQKANDLVQRIIDMAKVLFGLHMTEKPSSKDKTKKPGGFMLALMAAAGEVEQRKQQKWSLIPLRRKLVVVQAICSKPIYNLPRHRAINIFLQIYAESWLEEENNGQEQLVTDLTMSFEEAEMKKRGAEEESEEKADPLKQLITTFSRKATTEHGGAMREDDLYMKYAFIFSQSCGGAEEEEEEGGDEEGEGPSIHEQEMEKQRLLFQQARLADRGTAEMVLLYISACKGIPSPMTLKTLKLGISILRGGNADVQKRMLQHLQEKRDVGFFTSIAGLMNSCSVLDLDAFERNQKAEGLGVGSEGTAGEKNMHDAEFTCKLFRFLQLLCEGHNLDFQNYLRTQAGNTTTVNVVIATVDYLLRLQESIMDFYWHYSSKEIIDPSGQENFVKAITVAKQVFSTLTESIQGPCPLNQQALAHSRLWDAVGGFLFLFSHMQDKLAKNASQLDLLIELLDLQKEMVIMMLSMLEGNVVNGTIGKQMVDTLVESAANVELILKFFDMFLKLKELTTSATFQEYDKKQIGWITTSDFKKAMEQQKTYSPDEIQFLLSCCEPNPDGFIDYLEFTDRFHNPAKEIGFNLAVLLTNLSEHMPNEPRLQRFLETASSVLNYFEPFLGRIEIMGSSNRIERVYFEIKESSISQWEKPQIKESKRAFFYTIVTEGDDKEKLEAFVNFCEDTIFEMQHASNILMEEEEEPPSKAQDFPRPGSDEAPPSSIEPLKKLFRLLWRLIMGILSLFTPSNIHKQIQTLRGKTYGEILIGAFKISFKTVFLGGWSVYWLTSTVLRFILKLMVGEPIAGPPLEEEEEESKEPRASPFAALPAPSPPPSQVDTNGFGHGAPPPPSSPSAEQSADGGAGASEQGAGQDQVTNGRVHGAGDEATATTGGEEAPPATETARRASAQIESYAEEPAHEESAVEPAAEVEAGAEKAEEKPAINFAEYGNKIISFLAKNFYNMKYAALVIAFVINFMLLFYKVTQAEGDDEEGSGAGGSGLMDDDDEAAGSGLGSGLGNIIESIISGSGLAGSGEGEDDSILAGSGAGGSGFGAGDDDGGSGDDEEEPDIEEWVEFEDRLYYLVPVLRSLAILHSVFSFCMLIAYYHLKVPLVIFKREKEIGRKLEFDGLYIAEQPEDNDFFGHWDKLVISSKSFPVNYWDKFVKKRVREKYSEQYDFDSISQLLGMDASGAVVMEDSPPNGFYGYLTSVDWKYQIWKAGVTFTDNAFLYNLWYLCFSLLGNWNYFFFAAHLLDVAVCVKNLRTILQSVTHNGRQLMLTVLLLSIVVYIYTVIAFNFFRKFYVQGEEDDVDMKCHNMMTCFVYHLYQGVRAGGGIGDVIEPPDGDKYEVYRIIFDITFFFFVIVILLAIIQGLIIDAFGELRDQLQSVSDNMESMCFICSIGKDYFDRVPRGFETHVAKEHNLANYMFFLMHLINKPDTDYTGQETYVWELYQKRCWDFFPVGECFRKQYEEELSGGGGGAGGGGGGEG